MLGLLSSFVNRLGSSVNPGIEPKEPANFGSIEIGTEHITKIFGFWFRFPVLSVRSSVLD